MLIAHHREIVAQLRTPTASDPWRVLTSGCLAAWPCGVKADDNGLGGVLRDFFALPTLRTIAFCPEEHTLGAPRTTPDLHGGDGIDVLAGRARVLDEHGVDLTEAMIAGGRAMVELATREHAELAILTDASGACGTQVVSLGSRFVAVRQHQKGLGVAAAMLHEAGLPIVSQRDFHTLALLRARLEPGFVVPAGLRDHHEHDWTVRNLPGAHPRA